MDWKNRRLNKKLRYKKLSLFLEDIPEIELRDKTFVRLKQSGWHNTGHHTV